MLFFIPYHLIIWFSSPDNIHLVLVFVSFFKAPRCTKHLEFYHPFILFEHQIMDLKSLG